MSHRTADDLIALLSALAPEQRESLFHLLSCERCRRRLVHVLADDGHGGSASEIDTSTPGGLDRLWARVASAAAFDVERLARELEQADALQAELLTIPDALRVEKIAAEPKYRSAALCRLLVESALRQLTADPMRAYRLDVLALAIADRLEPPVSASRIGALRSRCWTVMGEIGRRCGDLAEAEESFAMAARTLDPEALDSPERSFLCRHLARLRRDQERIDEALALFQRAAAVAAVLSEDEDWGATLSDEGWLRLDEHDAESAVEPFEQAVAVLVPERSPGAALLARYGLALAWAESGEVRRARAAQEDARRAQSLLPSAVDQLLGVWLDSRVEARCGEVGPAADRLELAVRALTAEGAAYEAAAVALELARLLAEHGRPEGLAQVAALLSPILDSGKLHDLAREVASFALAYAVKAPMGSPELLERARSYLFRARHAQALPFRSRGSISALEWRYLSRATRADLCGLAGLPDDFADRPASEIQPAARRALSWAYQESRGVRLLFQEE
jgi:hypothetical protein